MEKWQTMLNLKFRRLPWRIKVGFSYEWKAWLIAYDLFNMGPEEFAKLNLEKQVTAIAYGAAAWYRMQKGKKVYFTYDDIADAMMKASKAENLMLSHAMSYAQFPEWLQPLSEGDKKKEKT